MAELTREDLRAAVAAGVLAEAQASRLIALAQARAGQRAAMTADEEPFELFRGFNEVFIALGVALLGAGIWALAAVWVGGMIDDTTPEYAAAIPALAIPVAVAWALAEWLTLRRRMVLPSLLLALGVAAGMVALGALLAALAAQVVFGLPDSEIDGEAGRHIVTAGFLLGAAGALGFHLRFRLPFALFLLSGALFIAMVVATADLTANFAATQESWTRALFDVGDPGGPGLLTLGFGVLAFAAAMAFDLRDPHRVTRLSACGFWLHLAAAPALVTTLAVSAEGLGGVVGTVALIAVVALITAVALVIDRRSFLTASLIWLWALISRLGGADADVIVYALRLLALGGFIVAVGAGWSGLRGRLMAALPAFPGKDRLPPWSVPA